MSGEVVADFTPGDEFVEERFSSRGHIPPACTAATGADGKFSGMPFFAASEGGEYFVGREVTEVEIGRETTGEIGVGFIAAVSVVGKFVGEEIF